MKKRLITIIKALCLIAVLYFLGKLIYENINALKHTTFKLDLLLFTLSFILYMVYKLYNAVLWHFITVKFDCSIRMDYAVVAWSYSQLGKFIPGKVFYLLARLYYYKKENISAKNVTFCFLLENAYTFISALFVFIASLPFIKLEAAEQYKLFGIIILVLFFLFLNPFFMEKSINIIFKTFKKEPVKLSLTYKELLISFVLFVSNWMVMGIGFYVLVQAVYPVGFGDFSYLTGASALANVIGILSFFAPTGIGVRETILIIALKAVMPAPYAVIVSIISRLWSTAGDLLTVLLAFGYEKARKL